MSSSNHEPVFSKKRTLSRFLAQELLYDFVTDQLDDERKLAVEEFLKNDQDLKDECESIRQAIEYCQGLKKVEVSEPVLRRHLEKKDLIAFFVEIVGWKKWPDYIKWSFEALFVVGFVVSIAVWIPWSEVQLFKPNQKKIKTGPTPSQLDFERMDEEDPEAELEIKISEKNKKIKQQLKDKEEQLAAQKIEVTKANEESTAPMDGPVEEPEVVQKEFTKKEIIKAKPVGNAFVFRGSMDATDLDVITPQLVNKIKALGGEKAGRVELGWRKPNASYFHFKMPEENNKEVIEFFNQYGRLEVEKTPHRRVMPSGWVRFIVEIKDASVSP